MPLPVGRCAPRPWGSAWRSLLRKPRLIVHAIAAPIFFAGVSLVYFRKFNFTSALRTAIIFLAFVMGMDLFVVALLILRSFDMFASLLGTWIPFVLIFASTYMTGLFIQRGRGQAYSASHSKSA